MRPTPRERVTEMLEALGLEAVTLYSNRGPRAKMDIMCWQGFATRRGVRVTLGSWDTMSDCAARGIEVSHDDGQEAAVMVSVAKPRFSRAKSQKEPR